MSDQVTSDAPPAQTEEAKPPQRLPDAELRQLAVDTANGKVYTDRHGADAIDAFMVIKLLAMSGKTPAFVEQWGMLYEYLTEAGPRTCNGRPTFFSCKILHVDDMPRFFELYREARAVIDALTKGPPSGG